MNTPHWNNPQQQPGWSGQQPSQQLPPTQQFPGSFPGYVLPTPKPRNTALLVTLTAAAVVVVAAIVTIVVVATRPSSTAQQPPALVGGTSTGGAASSGGGIVPIVPSSTPPSNQRPSTSNGADVNGGNGNGENGGGDVNGGGNGGGDVNGGNGENGGGNGNGGNNSGGSRPPGSVQSQKNAILQSAIAWTDARNAGNAEQTLQLGCSDDVAAVQAGQPNPAAYAGYSAYRPTGELIAHSSGMAAYVVVSAQNLQNGTTQASRLPIIWENGGWKMCYYPGENANRITGGS